VLQLLLAAHLIFNEWGVCLAGFVLIGENVLFIHFGKCCDNYWNLSFFLNRSFHTCHMFCVRRDKKFLGKILYVLSFLQVHGRKGG
jgi:hypothetical protein